MPHQKILSVSTSGSRLYEFTRDAGRFVEDVADSGPSLLTVFVRHTSCSLTIQENADPDVQRDLQAFFERLVPHTDHPSMAYLVHRMEGPDDMPAHIKSALTDVSLSIPVMDGRMLLGTWQGVYLWEHRRAPHKRDIVLHLA